MFVEENSRGRQKFAAENATTFITDVQCLRVTARSPKNQRNVTQFHLTVSETVFRTKLSLRALSLGGNLLLNQLLIVPLPEKETVVGTKERDVSKCEHHK